MKHYTIGRLFLSQTKKSANKNSIGWVENEELKFYSYLEYKNIVSALSLGLIKVGVVPGTKVSILAPTCKEWHLLDLSIMCARGICVPIYPYLQESDTSYILQHSDSNVLCIQNVAQLERILHIKEQLKNINLIITIEDLSSESENKLKEIAPVITYNDLLIEGTSELKLKPHYFEDLVKSQSESDIVSIIYTSGTTGKPKGAVICERALCQMLYNVESASNGSFGVNDRTLTFLPLSHVFGRCDSLLNLVFGWETVYCPTSEKIFDYLKIVQPTIMLAVPRIFEKIYEKIITQIEHSNIIKRKIFSYALEACKNYYQKIDQDELPTSIETTQYHILKPLVFDKVYNLFGGKIRFFVSGGAPLQPNLFYFLRLCGLTILEGYGLTETIAPCTLNPVYKQIPSTVGKPIGDVTISFADDGEILINTTALFSEYYKDSQATQEAFSGKSFRSGDIGEFTKEGFLKITDRKKDIIINSGGKNISPQKIELLMTQMPHISHFVPYGDQHNYLVGIIGIEKQNFITIMEELGLPKSCSIKELARSPQVRAILQVEVDQVNQQLSRFETIKKFIILEQEFSLENYLTPKLSIRKRLLFRDLQSKIDAMYLS